MSLLPLVSVLIPAYNAGPWIAETLESVLAQSWPHTEIIVVDDGSADNTLEVARRFEARGVRVFTRPNSGAAAARNHAFRESSGSYIQYIDADDLLATDKIEKQMQRLAQLDYPQEVLLSGRFAYFELQAGDKESEDIPLYRDFPNPLDWIDIAWNLGYFNHVAGWLVPRALIEKAGPWNEALSLNDDGEFFGRVVLESRSVLHVDAAKSFYRKVPGSLSKTVTDKAFKSLLQTAELYEKHLLAKKDSAETRRTCANVYMRMLHAYYPQYYKQILIAEQAVKRLGGSTLRLTGNRRVQLMERLIGWKRTKNLLAFVLENNLNPRAVFRKIGIRLPDNRNKYT